MKTELRHLAVHVVEQRVGDFRWVLIELSEDHTWNEIGAGTVGVGTYKHAMADGLVALEAMVRDLNHGPRRGVKQEHSRELAGHEKSKVRSQKNGAREEGSATQARSSVFGFGLAN